MIFWLCGKNGLIRNIGFNFKIYDVTTYISRNKGNQTMKFGQVIEYSKRNIFFKYRAENEAGSLHEVKWTWHTIKTYYIKLLTNAQFWFLRNGFGKFLHHILCTIFQIFFMLSSINWPKFLDWLPIPIVCFPDFDVINFEINLIFLTKPFFYMTKMSRQKFKYLENEISSFLKSFQFPKLFLDLRVHL